jgi:hypothetical protein
VRLEVAAEHDEAADGHDDTERANDEIEHAVVAARIAVRDVSIPGLDAHFRTQRAWPGSRRATYGLARPWFVIAKSARRKAIFGLGLSWENEAAAVTVEIAALDRCRRNAADEGLSAKIWEMNFGADLVSVDRGLFEKRPLEFSFRRLE